MYAGILGGLKFFVLNENALGSSSPYCGSVRSKFIVSFFNLGGVPVFNLPVLNPNSVKFSVSPADFSSPTLPPEIDFRPVCISPFKNVPQVRMTAFAAIVPRLVV